MPDVNITLTWFSNLITERCLKEIMQQEAWQNEIGNIIYDGSTLNRTFEVSNYWKEG